RHERLSLQQSQLTLALTHVLSNRRLGDPAFRPLLSNPPPDSMGRVFLFPRRVAVASQNQIDEFRYGIDLRSLSFGNLPAWRVRVGQRLPYHSPMHSKLLCHTFNGCIRPELELSPDLLK